MSAYVPHAHMRTPTQHTHAHKQARNLGMVLQGCHRKPRRAEGQGPGGPCALLRCRHQLSHAPPQPIRPNHALQLQVGHYMGGLLLTC